MKTAKIPLLTNVPIREGGELPLLKFPLLTECGIVKHGFTTRLGGVSEGIFESFNLSFSRGDKREFVEENFHRLSKALDVEYGSFVFSNQTHTTNVIRVDRKHAGNGILHTQAFRDVDGLVTNDPNVTLVTFYADCVPLYFVDTKRHAIGLSHSGWRGTVGRMGRVTLEKMKQEFDTNPKDVLCAVGPSICQNCYEVSEDVAAAFADEFLGYEDEILTSKGNGKYLLNLWKANEIVLTEAGIQKNHLAVTNLCTCCNPGLLFSHRASRGKRGNLAAVMALKNK